MRFQTMIICQSNDWFQPKLGLPFLPFNMNMLASFLVAVELKPVLAFAMYGWRHLDCSFSSKIIPQSILHQATNRKTTDMLESVT
jgi:hypothetical protein